METAVPAWYHTVDPIENLVIRVSLRRLPESTGGDVLTAVPAVTLSATLASVAGGPRLPTVAALPSVVDDDHGEQVVEFGWQQKVFGPR